jgi:hypothetical protein
VIESVSARSRNIIPGHKLVMVSGRHHQLVTHKVSTCKQIKNADPAARRFNGMATYLPDLNGRECL